MIPQRIPMISALLVALAGGAAEATAQDEPAAFLHGIRSNGAYWSSAQPFIESELRITGTSPTLGWSQSILAQAGTLHSSLQGLSDVIAVSHSNGGNVARRYLVTENGPRINRHITVGTPHRGAQLATSALDGELLFFAADVFSSIADPFDYYDAFDPDFWESYGPVASLVEFLVGTLGYLDYDLAYIGYGSAFAMQQLFGIVPDVLSDMTPNSRAPWNTPGPLQTEAARTTHRFSISTELQPLLQPYALFWGNPWGIYAFVATLIGYAEAEYVYYSNHPDYQLRAGAWLWQRLAVTLATMPVRYSQLIGAYNGPYAGITKNDGIVPWTSSAYPGGISLDIFAGEFGDVPHTGHGQSIAVRDRIRFILNDQMGVPERSAPPPPPPSFTAGIAGPATVPPAETCTFAATATGGTPPYQYNWSIDAVAIATGPFLYRSFSGGTSEISLVVTDASSVTAGASFSVSVDPYLSGCF